MGQLRAYLDRIQGRLLAAFTVAILGTIAIWYVGYKSLSEFSDDVDREIDNVFVSSTFGNRLESGITGQVAAGERMIAAPTPENRQAFDSLSADVKEAWRQYSMADTTTLRLNDNARRQLTNINQLHVQIERAYRSGDRTQVTGVRPAVEEIRAQLNALQNGFVNQLSSTSSALAVDSERRQTWLLILLITMGVVSGYFIWSTFRSIDRPLHNLVVAANQLGSGDLNVALNGRMPEEFRVLSGAFNTMAGQFRTIVGETVSAAQKIGSSAHDLSSISEQVAASSGQVSTAMVGITSGAEEQASGLRTVNEALEDIRRRAEEIDSSTDRVRDLSEQIRSLAEAKRIDIGRALSMLLELRQVVQSSRQEVTGLERASETITNFVETIQGLARQTNLLA